MELVYLDNNEIKQWDDFVKSSWNGTVFHNSWYLDSAGKGYQIKYLTVKENDTMVAGIPLCIKKRLNYTFILSPSLVSRQGVLFAKGTDEISEYKLLSQRKEAAQLIAKELKKYAYFLQNFTVEFNDWQPFMWEGYREEVAYTYILDNIKDHEMIWNNFSSKMRNTINKAEKLEIEIIQDNNNIEPFLQLYRSTFKRQELTNPVDFNVLENIIKESFANKAGAIYFARDKAGQLHSAAFVLYDHRSAYYLLSGSDPEYRSSGSISLLLWQIIKAASQRCEQFDFEGSNIPGIEKHFRAFGGKLAPYFKISKANSKLISIYKKIRS